MFSTWYGRCRLHFSFNRQKRFSPWSFVGEDASRDRGRQDVGAQSRVRDDASRSGTPLGETAPSSTVFYEILSYLAVSNIIVRAWRIVKSVKNASRRLTTTICDASLSVSEVLEPRADLRTPVCGGVSDRGVLSPRTLLEGRRMRLPAPDM